MPNTQQPPPATVSWKVTGQQETTQRGPTGQLVQGIKVMFTLGDGTNGSVFVPEQSYSVATVHTMIADRAAQLAAVSNLSAGQ